MQDALVEQKPLHSAKQINVEEKELPPRAPGGNYTLVQVEGKKPEDAVADEGEKDGGHQSDSDAHPRAEPFEKEGKTNDTPEDESFQDLPND